jgi:thymidylate synthase (FAD)
MHWIESSVELVEPIDAVAAKRKVEIACRNCYKSEDKIEDGSAERLIRSCIKRGHESPLEHYAVTYRVICDRAILAEWTRHRLASYCVESQRYCAYNKDKFGSTITCVLPTWAEEIQHMSVFDMDEAQKRQYLMFQRLDTACCSAEATYFAMLGEEMRPEDARAILPNCVKTDIVCTMNLRELRHFIRLRSSAAAHPDIRKLAIQLLKLMRDNGLGVFFEDIEVEDAGTTKE